MKKVITGRNSLETIAHMFAHKQQDEARNSGSNFYFERETLYSYGRHFIIARHTNFNGKNAILFTLDKYSVTTAKQISIADRAIPDYMNKIYCPTVQQVDGNTQHEKNIHCWERDMKLAFEKMATARKKEKYIQEIEGIIYQLKKYMEYYELNIHDSLQALISDATPENFKNYLDKENERITAENKARIAAQKKSHTKQLNEWRNFEINRLSVHSGYDYLRFDPIKSKGRIETTQGIEIPLERAQRFYYTVMDVISNGGCNGSKCGQFMTFDIKEITSEYMVIGCHKIEIKEIKRIAKIFGWQYNKAA